MMAANVVAFLILVSSLHFVDAASYKLTSKHDQIREHAQQHVKNMTITYRAGGSPLADCQFAWWDGATGQMGPLLELGLGPRSQLNRSLLNNMLIGYSYSGRGLAEGDCGVSLQVVGSKEWMVGSRFRTQNGGWRYAWTDLYADTTDPIRHTLTPRQAVIVPGGEARFTLMAQEKLDQCRFYPPGAYFGFLMFFGGPSFDNTTGRHLYHGRGLGRGDCGLTLRDVGEADNGPVRCYLRQGRRQEVRFLPLVVAHPPSNVSLRVAYQGTRVTARCEVTTSRPLANITWLLGDEVLRRDALDDSHRDPRAEWRWPWTRGTVAQTLAFTLQPELAGKLLRCLVSHAALVRPLEASRVIWITVAEPYNLTISPEHLEVSADPNNVTITCNADVALTGCQFRWWDIQTGPGPLLDLSRGSKSWPDSDHLNNNLTGYGYFGRGPTAGDCGVSLEIEGVKKWMVFCRVRTRSGGWRYARTELRATILSHLPHTLTPSETVVLSGGEARITLKARQALGWCQFTLSSGLISFRAGVRSRDSTGRHIYRGGGLRSGECGLSLANVSEADNGLVHSFIGNGSRIASGFTSLIVAIPPSSVTLRVTLEGANVSASCEVTTGRPPANITWLLGDEVLRRDALDDSHRDPRAEWRWPCTRGTVAQTIVFTLKPGFTVKVLKCRASHVALATPLEDSKGISFTARCPSVASNNTIVSCYFEGEPVDCGRLQRHGTLADVTCKPGFVALDGVDHKRITCLDTDVWDKSFTCRPDCGLRKSNSGIPQISHGTAAIVNEFPWHVAIYQMDANSYIQICGGSLITSRIVISAAHCFWNNSAGARSTASYAVAAGKHGRAWEDDADVVQRREVEVVVVPPDYHGRESNFQGDIAVVRLAEELDLTTDVNLVCVDWAESLSPAGTDGMFAGWGYTEADRLSSSLRQVALPVVDRATCYRGLDASTKPLLTQDKMCAGYVDTGISTCRGDSGGGLVNLDEASNRYYLTGVLSIAFKPPSSNDLCYAQFYTAFTIVARYYEWIRVNL